MKIKFLKEHLGQKLEEVSDVDDPRANYLIRVGVAVAEMVEQEAQEKSEHTKAKEKRENKTGNVPTAKKQK